ncbi:MAG: hypothetical protein L6V93_04355 [Clostridiales bacterium]|nr:MAG: hypothetical protein L6V93_04355 [Clostridiales bacterium]
MISPRAHGCSAPQKQTFEERFEKNILICKATPRRAVLRFFSNKTENSYKFALCSEKDGARMVEYPKIS